MNANNLLRHLPRSLPASCEEQTVDNPYYALPTRSRVCCCFQCLSNVNVSCPPGVGVSYSLVTACLSSSEVSLRPPHFSCLETIQYTLQFTECQAAIPLSTWSWTPPTTICSVHHNSSVNIIMKSANNNMLCPPQQFRHSNGDTNYYHCFLSINRDVESKCWIC